MGASASDSRWGIMIGSVLNFDHVHEIQTAVGPSVMGASVELDVAGERAKRV